MPTPVPNAFQTKVELFKFFRKIKLKYFFHKDRTTLPLQVTPADVDCKFKRKSTFCPPTTSPSISTFCNLVENDIQKLFQDLPPNSRGNLSHGEKQALMRLSKNNDIVVKPCDKGGGLTLLNKSDYDNEIRRQLSDTSFYQKLQFDPTRRFKMDIDTFLANALSASTISKPEKEYLTNDYPTKPVLYTLPKVHKSLTNVPGRPIVSGIGGLTEPLSNFVDAHIRPLVTRLPSYIRDTGDFLEQLSHVQLPSEGQVHLVTLDVCSLYTNIPHNSGLLALQYFLDNREDLNPPTKFLVEMSNLILTKNYFLYENDFFLQIQGVAMGATFAPDFANLFMGFLEDQHIHSNNPFCPNLIFYKRFIDDVCAIFLGSHTELSAFGDYMNSLSPTIKFTMESSVESIHFLDTCISLSDNKLSSSLYVKPTDKNSFLHAKSYHTLSLKKSLPYSQFLRIKRICSSPTDFEKEAQKLSDQFIARGYPVSWLNTALSRARSNVELPGPRPKKPHSDRLLCCTTYSPISCQVKEVITKHWHVLSADDVGRKLFADAPLFVHSRGPNIRDRLVHADSHNSNGGRLDGPVGFFPCRHCHSCQNHTKTNTFVSHSTQKEHKIKHFITCRSSNVIYLLSCPCGLQYVGKTSRQLRIRINEHRSAIQRGDPKSPVARHFQEAQHPTNTLRFCGIDKIYPSRRHTDHNTKLLQIESKWIFMLKTEHPSGLNEMLNLACFL